MMCLIKVLMKKNIIILLFILIIGVFSLEIFADQQIKKLITRNGFTEDLIIFYDRYYKVLHHLGRLNEVDSNKPSSLIFDEIGNGKSHILVQGDSWAEQFRSRKSQKYLQKYLNQKKQYKFVLAGTGSYSPSVMTSQLNLLRKDFNFDPDFLIAIIDQTDIGDELCRYKNLRKRVQGKIIVEPEPIESFEYNASSQIIDNFKMFFSNHFALFKIAYYLKNKIVYRVNKNNYRIRCGRNQILAPLENGIKNHDKLYVIEVLNDYFDEAFSSSNLKELIIVTHPHKRHLSNNFVLDIGTLIQEAKEKSIYRKKIKSISFLEILKNFSDNEINEIFIEGDPYSHLNDDYFLNNFLPNILAEID